MHGLPPGGRAVRLHARQELNSERKRATSSTDASPNSAAVTRLFISGSSGLPTRIAIPVSRMAANASSSVMSSRGTSDDVVGVEAEHVDQVQDGLALVPVDRRPQFVDHLPGNHLESIGQLVEQRVDDVVCVSTCLRCGVSVVHSHRGPLRFESDPVGVGESFAQRGSGVGDEFGEVARESGEITP